MPAKKKRALILGGIAVLSVGGLAVFSRDQATKTMHAPVSANNVLTKADTRALSVATLNRSVTDVNTEVAKLKSEKEQLDEQNRQLGNQLLKLATTVQQMQMDQARRDALAAEEARNGPPTGAGGIPLGHRMVMIDVNAESAPDAGEKKADSPSSPAGAEASAKDEPANAASYLPAGSIVTGVLLTGVDAPTGRSAMAQPIPVLIRVKTEAILPNRFREDVAECHIIGAAFGDLSSERAFIRSERISCIRNDGGVVETPIEMYAAGEDGKAGMRGRLVSKQGQALARAMLAGAASGIAQAFKPQQVQYLSSGSGSGYQQIPGGQAAQLAGFGGVSSAMEQAAQFYMQLAEQQFPVIEVSAGREISFIVTKGKSLKLTSAEAK